MKKYVRALLLATLVLLSTAVFSVATTVLMLPLWSWLESSSGIESVGHSGPAAWCYGFVFILLLVVLASAIVLRCRVHAGQTRGMG